MIIIMLGAPGTGKGTVAGILKEALGIPQISTGDIFRENIKNKTELGELAGKYMAEGKLVPDDVTIRIVEERIKLDDVKNGAILDGFPRTVYQAERLDEILKSRNEEVRIVINLTTPEDEILERVVNRRVCSNPQCGAVYNVILSPSKVEGICDKCGSKLVTRKDDNVETVKSRLSAYLEQTSPLVDFYDKKGILYSTIVSKDTKMGQEVAKDIVEYLKGE